MIIPGLVDLHLHAPQYSFRGLGMDLELMDWLNQRTFPEETKYQNLDYANRAYSIFVKNMKNSATTHACIFATIHLDATKLLMDKMEESGLVSYVGKVNMDRNAPKDLCEDNVSLAYLNTRNWVEETNHLYERTKPILTPRFIPSCSEDLLEGSRNVPFSTKVIVNKEYLSAFLKISLKYKLSTILLLAKNGVIFFFNNFPACSRVNSKLFTSEFLYIS